MSIDNSALKQKLGDRYRNKRSLGVPIDPRGSSVKQDIESGLAEKFACDYLGCEFNDKVLDGNDGGYDFLYNNLRVDVKWLGFFTGTETPRTHGRIIVDIHKLGRADIYIGVTGSEKTSHKIIGWCTSNDLKESLWVSNFPDENGIYERYALHSNKLRNIQNLKNYQKS